MKLRKTAERAAGKQRSCGSTNQRRNVTVTRRSRAHHELEIKRILVPVDFSEPSKRALDYAISVASEFDAELILLHVVQPYPILPDLPAPTVELTAILGREADTKLKKLADAVKAVAVKRLVRFGNPAREIADEAKKQDADLIIINTHGRTGFAHLFIGSVAELVVRLAKCPVLTLHDGVKAAVHDAAVNRAGAEPVSI